MSPNRSARIKSIDNAKDPYLSKVRPSDMAICKKCSAIYHNKRWSLSKRTALKAAEKKRQAVLCPACQKKRDGFAEGFVTLKGEFVKKNRDELISMIKNRETRAIYYNPLSRIMDISVKRSGTIEVTTTTDKFAQRLGQLIQKAYNGKVEYKWSADTKITRVIWTR